MTRGTRSQNRFLTNLIFAISVILFLAANFSNDALAQTKMPDKPSQAQATKAGLAEDANVEEELDELDEDAEEEEDPDTVAEEAESDSIPAAPEEMPVLQRKKTANAAVSDSNDPIELDQAPVPQIKKKKGRIDPQFRQGSRFIEHPNASKGLIRIEKDRTYVYKVKSSEQNKAVSVRLGTYEPLDLASPDNTNLSYETLYSDESLPILLYDQERQITKKFGKLGWKWGTGFKMATGHGAFEDGRPDEPPEKFTMFMFPFNIGAIYRFQYWDGQLIVPYAEGGVDGMVFAEYRDDDQNPPLGAAFGFAPATHFSFGGSLQLGSGARSFLDLDREYGINSVWISGEYRYYVGLSDKYDFTGDAISAGITAEY